MRLNIIHIPQRKDRMNLLQKELAEQSLTDYKLWDGIVDEELPCRGISKAHKQIVKFAKDNSLSEILIAEDDVHFTSKHSLTFFLNNKPSEYDLYLSGIYFGEISKEKTVQDFSGLTLYCIHERFYDLFLSVSEDQHLDRALNNKGEFKVCYPFVATQHNGYSDNLKTECDYQSLMKGRILYTEMKE